MAQNKSEADQVEQPSLGELVATASAAASDLMRAEIALAKAELRSEVRKAALGGGMFAGAAVFGLFAFLLLSFAAAYGIAVSDLPTWAGFGILGGGYLLLAGILAGVGLRSVLRIKAPERTVRATKDTVATLKSFKGARARGESTGAEVG